MESTTAHVCIGRVSEFFFLLNENVNINIKTVIFRDSPAEYSEPVIIDPVELKVRK